MGFSHLYLDIEIRASTATFINLHFHLQFKKSCTSFVLVSTATQKVCIAGMSSTAAISQGKLPSVALRARFKLSLGSTSSFHRLPSNRNYLMIQLHMQFCMQHFLLFSHLIFIVKGLIKWASRNQTLSLYCFTIFIKICVHTGDGMDVNGAVCLIAYTWI